MGYAVRRGASLIVILALLSVSARAQQPGGLPANKVDKIEKAISEQMSRRTRS